MEHRQLGRSGFNVPVLTLGTGTFGGKAGMSAWGSTDVAEATRLVDVCLEHGLTMFDSADIYSAGASEEVLGGAIKGRRDKVLISTKATFRAGRELNDVGSSRFHLVRAVEGSLKRLGTDHIDLFQLHGYDAKTPPEEVLTTLDTLIRAGKILYTGVSNFSGWHLMKALAVADRYGLPRYVANQTYYSLIGRDYEWELMPLGLDQGVGAVVWSPLGWGRLTGKIRRGAPLPEVSRRNVKASNDMGPPANDEYVFKVVDALVVVVDGGKVEIDDGVEDEVEELAGVFVVAVAAGAVEGLWVVGQAGSETVMRKSLPAKMSIGVKTGISSPGLSGSGSRRTGLRTAKV